MPPELAHLVLGPEWVDHGSIRIDGAMTTGVRNFRGRP